MESSHSPSNSAAEEEEDTVMPDLPSGTPEAAELTEVGSLHGLPLGDHKHKLALSLDS